MWNAPSALVGASRTRWVAISRTVTAAVGMRPPLESPTEPSNAPLTSDVCAQEAVARQTPTRSALWRRLTFSVYSVERKETGFVAEAATSTTCGKRLVSPLLGCRSWGFSGCGKTRAKARLLTRAVRFGNFSARRRARPSQAYISHDQSRDLDTWTRANALPSVGKSADVARTSAQCHLVLGEGYPKHFMRVMVWIWSLLRFLTCTCTSNRWGCFVCCSGRWVEWCATASIRRVW